jgi:hypothetical protein
MKEKNSIIVCAAMKMKDGMIIPGVRHFSPEMRQIMQRIYGNKYHLQVDKQGFIDQYGDFYSRREAFLIANNNSQIRRPTGFESVGEPQRIEDEHENAILFSENLY